MPDFSSLLGMTIFGQNVEGSDLAVVALLVILEGVLSIDNALVLGLLAKRLPARQRQRALTYGLVGAFVFRVIAICTASLLLQWTFVKFLGGAYLAFIAIKHIFFESKEEVDEKIELDEHGHPVIHDREGHDLTPQQEEIELKERVPLPSMAIPGADPESKSKPGPAVRVETAATMRHFWYTVAVIELTDVAFAVDSILAAMALAGSRQDKLWVVVTGGILGVILMRFAAVIFIRLLEKFPRFELAAYLLVLIIGVKLLADWGANSDWSFQQTPAVARSLGSWEPTMIEFEKNRRETVKNYEHWLKENWIFDIPVHDYDDHEHEPIAAELPKDDVVEEPSKIKLPPKVPHLLDFHDLRRPECMTFWIIMLICFGIGFIKPREDETPKVE